MSSATRGDGARLAYLKGKPRCAYPPCLKVALAGLRFCRAHIAHPASDRWDDEQHARPDCWRTCPCGNCAAERSRVRDG